MLVVLLCQQNETVKAISMPNEERFEDDKENDTMKWNIMKDLYVISKNDMRPKYLAT